jgi:hypothetical protein
MYSVSHMVLFTSTKKRKFKYSLFKSNSLIYFLLFIKKKKKDNYVRYIKNPEGPTLTFKIISYSDKK